MGEAARVRRRAHGAVTHVQRFGSSVNLNVHFHSMVLDGVFTRDDQGARAFIRRLRPRVRSWARSSDACTGAPSHGSRGTTCWTHPVAARVAGAGRRRHRSMPAPRSRCSAEPCAPCAMTPEAAHEGGGGGEKPPRDEGAVEIDGFNLHASVAIAGDDDLGRERLMRYGARPPLALDRLRRLPDGRIAYRIKKLRGGRAKHRVMTPLEFLARLGALVPPPRYPLLRYAGVLGPRSSWRRDVVPRAPQSQSLRPGAGGEGARRPRQSRESGAGATPTRHCRRGRRDSRDEADPATCAAPLRSTDDAVDAPGAGAWQLLTPNVLGVKHWNRLLGGALYAAPPRVDWASFLRRSFEVDVLACPSCGGRLRVLGEVTEPAMVRLVLDSLGMPTDAPRAARARDPTELLGEHVDA